jgi:hypothetical protein
MVGYVHTVIKSFSQRKQINKCWPDCTYKLDMLSMFEPVTENLIGAEGRGFWVVGI